MNLLARILRRIAFIRAEYAADGSCRTETFLWRRETLTPSDPKAAKKVLTALIVCGHGVLTKPDPAEVSARIKADPQTFLWTSIEGRTSFVRREQVQGTLDRLSEEGIVPAALFCADDAADFPRQANAFARQLHAGLRWRSLLRPTAEGSAAAQAVARWVALPVCGSLLCLLIGNVLVSPGIEAKREALQSACAAREQTLSAALSTHERQRRLMTRFAARPCIPRSVTCDRIAASVPERIVLTRLEIEPLTRRFEVGKPLPRQENRAFLCGTTPAASDLTLFVQRLSASACCREVRLSGVERQHDGDRLAFRIEIVL